MPNLLDFRGHNLDFSRGWHGDLHERPILGKLGERVNSLSCLISVQRKSIVFCLALWNLYLKVGFYNLICFGMNLNMSNLSFTENKFPLRNHWASLLVGTIISKCSRGNHSPVFVCCMERRRINSLKTQGSKYDGNSNTPRELINAK